MDKRNRKIAIVLLVVLLTLFIVGAALFIAGNDGNKSLRLAGVILIIIYTGVLFFALIYVGILFTDMRKVETANGEAQMSVPRDDRREAPPERKKQRKFTKFEFICICIAGALILLAVAFAVTYFVLNTYSVVSAEYKLFTVIFCPTALILSLVLLIVASRSFYNRFK